MSNTTPLVSILMPTFNHGRFIAQALEGCLMQQTDFEYRLIVCDDCSTDNTREIVDDYAARHKNIIRSYQPVNSRGANNFFDGLKLCITPYLAMCEGDDYWTDPYKLQKQISFMEENPAFNVSAHRAKIVYEEGVPHNAGSFVYKNLESDLLRVRLGVFTPEEAMDNYYFHTSSLVFRWLFRDGLPPWFAKRMLWDHFLFLLHADNSYIKYFDEPMSCWRHHSAGWTFLQNIDKSLFFSYKNDDWNEIYKEIDKFFEYRYHKFIKKRTILSLENSIAFCLRHNEFGRLRTLVRGNRNLVRRKKDNNEIFRQAWDIVYPQEVVLNLPWTGKTEIASREDNEDIGGIRPLPIRFLDEVEGSIWDLWVGGREHACFATINQAIMRWLYGCRAERVWEPNYYDPLVDELRAKIQVIPIYYECGANLRPDTSIVDAMRPGDAIITCAWFGRPTPMELQQKLAAREDIFWIEDRRHVLHISEPSLAPVVAYSAPNLLGMPDGGILVGRDCAGLDRDLPWKPDEVFNAGIQYTSNAYNQGRLSAAQRREFARENERAFLPISRCSPFTLKLMKCLKADRFIEPVQESFHILHESLKDICFWQDLAVPPDFTPFAFPALFPNQRYPHITADIAQSLLHNAGILAVRQWYPLIVEQMNQWEYSGSQDLSRKLLLIPCDWRQTREDMSRVVDVCQEKFVEFEAKFG